MIQLPQLQIVRDEHEEVRCFLKLKAFLAKDDNHRTEGIHASDLLDPRRAYWQRVEPKETTERQVFFYVIGKTLHSMVIAAETETIDGATDAGTHEALGVQFSPDMIRDGRPIEFKTHRGQSEPPPDRIQEHFSNYFEQLVTYLVLMNRLEGVLWVLFISLKDATGRTFPEIRCYRVVMTEEQFYEVEQHVLMTRDVLSDALGARDPHRLPLCRTWLCGETACAWWGSCKPEGRYPLKDRRKWTA